MPQRMINPSFFVVRKEYVPHCLSYNWFGKRVLTLQGEIIFYRFFIFNSTFADSFNWIILAKIFNCRWRWSSNFLFLQRSKYHCITYGKATSHDPVAVRFKSELRGGNFGGGLHQWLAWKLTAATATRSPVRACAPVWHLPPLQHL